jgi:hypothetical protein
MGCRRWVYCLVDVGCRGWGAASTCRILLAAAKIYGVVWIGAARRDALQFLCAALWFVAATRQGPAVDAMLHRYWPVKAELSLRPHLSARQCQGAQVLELPEGLNRIRTVMFRFFGKLQMHRRLN